VGSGAISRADYERQVVDHLFQIEGSLVAMAQDIADMKASLDRSIVLCGRIHATLVQMGREIERVH
jgi:hypothetical protein